MDFVGKCMNDAFGCGKNRGNETRILKLNSIVFWTHCTLYGSINLKSNDR